MRFKHIKAEDVGESDFGSVKVSNLLSEESYDKLSIARVKIGGEQKLGLDQESDTAYYVLEGTGKFFVEDEEFSVKKGDLVFIPKKTQYKDAGDLTLLAISVPKFDRSKRVRFG